MRTHRKRRIRKKRRIGEFTEYGFAVVCLPFASTDALWAFILRIEALGLLCGGGGNLGYFEGFVTVAKGSCTEADREAVRAIECVVTVGGLEDAWA